MRECRWVSVCFVIVMICACATEAWATPRCGKKMCAPQVGAGWLTSDGKTLFVPVADKVWRTYKGRQLTKHIYHEYRRNGNFVALYDTRRHIAVRLHRRFVLGRWSFRAGLPMWILVHRGGWVRAQKTVATAPTPRKTPPTSRPASRRASPAKRVRPTSRPAPSSRPISRPAPRVVVRQVAPATPSSLRGLPRLPKVKLRRLYRRYAWASARGQLRAQHVAGQLWRAFLRGVPTPQRLVELNRTQKHVTFVAPMRKYFVRLSANQWEIKQPDGDWRKIVKGAWVKKRIPLRFSWVAAGQKMRWHHLRGRYWGLFRNGRFAKKLLRMWEANPTYIALGSATLQVRLYENRAFYKRAGRIITKWRPLGKGTWDDNPATYPLPHKLRQLLASLRKAASKRRAPAKKQAPGLNKSRLARRRPPARQAPPKKQAKATKPSRRVALARNKRQAALRKKAPTRRTAPRKKALTRRTAPKKRHATVQRQDPRVRVTKPKANPWRKVVFVRITLKNGRKRFASGVMIGPRTVLTAGHVIYDRKTKKTARTLWVYPALHNRKMTYGATYPLRWAVHPKWISAKTSREANNHDLAVVHLKKPLGLQTGVVTLQPAPPLVTKLSTMYTMGYPLDKFFKTKKLWMWYSHQKGHAKAPATFPWSERILTNHRVFRGNDGGPLLRRKGWVLAGICRSRAGKRADFVRMTRTKVDWIKASMRKLQGAFKPKMTPFDGDDEPPDELRFWEGQGVDLDTLGKQK